VETSVNLLERLNGAPTDEPAARVAEEMGVSLNSVLLAKSRVLKRLRQEAAGFVE
jgi:RNA polymerase sigma-70 factor (ECF subfamily)